MYLSCSKLRTDLFLNEYAALPVTDDVNLTFLKKACRWTGKTFAGFVVLGDTWVVELMATLSEPGLDGCPALHDVLAGEFWKLKKYGKAQTHFLRGSRTVQVTFTCRNSNFRGHRQCFSRLYSVVG